MLLPDITRKKIHFALEELSGKPFFFPRVAFVVVAALLPKAWRVFSHQFDAIDPFGALPAVDAGND